jgi:hypothetical protein
MALLASRSPFQAKNENTQQRQHVGRCLGIRATVGIRGAADLPAGLAGERWLTGRSKKFGFHAAKPSSPRSPRCEKPAKGEGPSGVRCLDLDLGNRKSQRTARLRRVGDQQPYPKDRSKTGACDLATSPFSRASRCELVIRCGGSIGHGCGRTGKRSTTYCP